MFDDKKITCTEWSNKMSESKIFQYMKAFINEILSVQT